MHPQNFMIFGTYELHTAENEMMLSLFHYVNSYSPEGATNMSSLLSICIIAVLLSLNVFTLKQCILFCIHYKNFIVNKNSSGFAVW